jgi:hypothetical protein
MGDISGFVINSIFRGSLILIPCLFVMHKFGFEIRIINKPVLIRTINGMLLFGSVIYLTLFLFVTFMSVFSLGVYEHNHYSNPDFGHYGWERWIVMIIPYGFLPQLLWIRKFRHSIICSFTIIAIWGLLTLVTILPVFYFNWVDYLKQIAVYLVIAYLVYFALSGKKAVAN